MTVSSPPPASVTPAMRQYFDAKARYRDAILFFRMGDFFEMFYEDALTAARALELTLTSRSKDAAGNAIPMCGIPFHAADGYITRLVKRGFRVAICDQIEDPKQAKGIVKRDVTRVVSPGTLTDASYLDAREPAFLLALAPGSGDRLGVALLDASTGEFLAAEYDGADGRQALNEELGVLRPREVIVAQGVEAVTLLPEIARLGIAVTPLDEWAFGVDRATKTLCDQLRTSGLHAFGLDGHPAAICAAGALVEYLRDTQKVDLAHVRGHRLARAAGRTADRSDDVPAPRDPRGRRGRPRGIAVVGARSHPDGDGRAPAARLADASAHRARADPGSARRRRGVRLQGHRAGPPARDAAGRPRSRAPDRPRRHRHRRPARPGRRCASRWRPSRASAWSSSRWPRRSSRAWSASWTISPTSATRSPPR